jgi:hypothetical protein
MSSSRRPDVEAGPDRGRGPGRLGGWRRSAALLVARAATSSYWYLAGGHALGWTAGFLHKWKINCSPSHKACFLGKLVLTSWTEAQRRGDDGAAPCLVKQEPSPLDGDCANGEASWALRGTLATGMEGALTT